MGLFKSSRYQPAVTIFLRHMQHGRFAQALKSLRRLGDGPVPPPHALWRIGRWCLDRSRPKAAREPLELFLELYPAHQDRPSVMRDLARVLALTGEREQAQELAKEAEAMGRSRDGRRRDQQWRDLLLSGRAKQFALNGAESWRLG